MERQAPFLNVETSHLEGYDVLTNHAQSSIPESELTKLRQIIENQLKGSTRGLSPSWTHIKGHKDLLVDDEIHPHYLAKGKDMPIIVSTLRSIREGTPVETRDSPKDRVTAISAISSELSLSPKIKKIISSDEVQQIFKPYIHLIDYVEPLIGIICRATGQKYLIYQYIRGNNFDSFSKKSLEIAVEISKRVEILRDVFRKNQIEPYDLLPRQLMMEEKPGGLLVIHLIDTEMYCKLPS